MKKGLPAARAGDFMRVADSLRLAIELAETAADLAEQRGGAAATVATIRRQIADLKAAP